MDRGSCLLHALMATLCLYKLSCRTSSTTSLTRFLLRQLLQSAKFPVSKYTDINMKGCWQTIFFVTLLACGILARNADSINYERDNRRQTGSMLAEIAKELVQRSTSTSQVLNLNLSNLLLLLVLKAVVFGAGYLGNHGQRSREINEENVVSESEVALALGYLIGDTCLYRAACEVPNTAKDYLGAVEMIIQTMKLMPQSAQLDRGYEKTITDFKKAIEYGMTSQCPPEYTCKKESIHNFLRPE